MLTSMGSWRQNFFTFCISALSLVPRCPSLLSGMDTVGRPAVTRCSEHEEMSFMLWFHGLIYGLILLPKGQVWQRLTYQPICDILGPNKMPPFYALRGWLLFFLPYKGCFSDLIHFPVGLERHCSHVSECCLKSALRVLSLSCPYLL